MSTKQKIVVKNDKLTKEQTNKILRAHKVVPTLTKEQLAEAINTAINDIQLTIDIKLVCRSIITLKDKAALAKLMTHPRPDVRKAALRLQKIPIFRNLEATQDKIYNSLECNVFFMECAEANDFAKFYTNCHKYEPSHYTEKRNYVPFKKNIKKQLSEIVVEDLIKCKQNQQEVVKGGKITVDVVTRLQFAYLLLGDEFLKLAKPYANEFQLLEVNFGHSNEELIEIFGLQKNNKIQLSNICYENIMAYKLHMKQLLGDFNFKVNSSQNFSEDQIKRNLIKRLANIDLIDKYDISDLDYELVSDEMINYHLFKKFTNYDEMNIFKNQYQIQQSNHLMCDKRSIRSITKEPHSEINQITASVVKDMQKFITENPQYKTSVVNPVYVIMIQQPFSEHFDSYPSTEEKVEYTFEKNILSKRGRFMNSDQRIQAMKALLIAPFVNNQQKAISRIMRYLCAAAQKTANQTEKDNILEVINPTQFFQLVIQCLLEKLIDVDFVKLCSEIALVYLQYQDILQKLIPNINTVMQNSVTYLMNNGFTQIDNLLPTILKGLIQLQQQIPLIKYTLSKMSVKINSQTQQLIIQDRQFAYTKQHEGKIVKVGLANKFIECATEQIYKEEVINHIEKSFEYEYQFYDKIVENIVKTQPFYIECKKKYEAAVEQNDDKQLKKVQFEKLYYDYYNQIMKSLEFTQIGVFKLEVKDDKQNKKIQYLIQTKKTKYNESLSEIKQDYKIHQNSITILQKIVNQVVINAKSLSFNSLVDKEQKYCNMFQSSLRFLKSLLHIIQYASKQYQDNYDQQQLKSQFEIQNIDIFHKDVLKLMGCAVKQICKQNNRYDKLSELFKIFCLIYLELKQCNQQESEEYTKCFTEQFQRKKAEAKNKQRAAKKTVDTGKFQNELKEFLFSLDILIKNMASSQMIQIVGQLMSVELFAALGVYCVTHLQHSISYDKDAKIEELFIKPMPMSSFKLLIKFMFKSQGINYDNIVNLFNKSSTDAKVCMLQQFYDRIIADKLVNKADYLKFIQSIKDKNPDVLNIFFSSVFENEKNVEFNKEIMTILSQIVEQQKEYNLLTVQLVNYAGYLKVQIPQLQQEKFKKSFSFYSYNQEEIKYVLIYLFYYTQNKQEIVELVVQLYDQYLNKNEHSTTVLKKCVVELLQQAAKYQLINEAIDLQTGILKVYDKNDKSLDFDINFQFENISKQQLEQLVTLLIRFNSDNELENFQINKLLSLNCNAFTQGYLQILLQQGIKNELIQKLNEHEQTQLKMFARRIGYNYNEVKIE